MAKKAAAKPDVASSLRLEKSGHRPDATRQKPSSLLDTRVVYCGDNLEPLAKLPDACVGLIYIDPPFNSNADYNILFREASGEASQAQFHPFTDNWN